MESPSNNSGNSGGKRHYFQSHYLHFGTYDPGSRRLSLSFYNGVRATHFIPPALWGKLQQASSPGAYYREHIQGTFPDAEKETA